MGEIIRFVLGRLVTRSFWFLFITSLMGMLMYELRGTFKDQIFQDAVKHMTARRWPGWKTP